MQRIRPAFTTTLTEEDFRTRAAHRLARRPSPYIFDPRTDTTRHIGHLGRDTALANELFSDIPLRDAAVLVPVVARTPMTVLFTKRTNHLPSHAGQIAFPGGKLEQEDADPIAAALREAKEEVGLDAEYIEPVGYLNSVRTRTGYHIMPVVALVRPGFNLDINYSEVDEAFEVPLTFLMDPTNHRKEVVSLRERVRHIHAVPFARRPIWGVTAGIIKNMQMRLFSGHTDEL